MKLALHSVSYAGLWRNQFALSLHDFLHKAADLGYQGVELMGKRPHLSILEMGEREIDAVRSQLHELSLECACIAGYTDFTAGSGFIPMLEMQLIYVDGLARIAGALHCPIVRIFTGYQTDAPYWSQWDACVKAIRECSKRAAAYGVNIGIQNHHDIAVDAASLAALIEEVNEPNCKAMFDAWAPTVQGLDLSAAVRALAGKIAFTTVADYQRVPCFQYRPDLVNYEQGADLLKAVPMGEGFIDYEQFFSALKAADYDGYVSYEMCSEISGGGSEANLDHYAKTFVRYMKGHGYCET